MYPANQNFEPAKISPIVHPDTPAWVRSLLPSAAGSGLSIEALRMTGLGLLPFAVATTLMLLGGPFLGVGVTLLVLSVAGLLGGTVVGVRRLGPNVVSAPDYTYRGVPITGKALDMLADVQHRFLWAEKMFGQVPAGIRWDEVDEQVAVLLWEAAGHAAKVSALDVEISELAYAPPASPQGALRKELQRTRAELWASLEVTQREADDLAREASNAAAAARIALSRTGSVHDLEILAPSGANLVARGTLAAARARLALLTEVWSELDETGAIADAAFEGRRRELPAAD